MRQEREPSGIISIPGKLDSIGERTEKVWAATVGLIGGLLRRPSAETQLRQKELLNLFMRQIPSQLLQLEYAETPDNNQSNDQPSDNPAQKNTLQIRRPVTIDDGSSTATYAIQARFFINSDRTIAQRTEEDGETIPICNLTVFQTVNGGKAQTIMYPSYGHSGDDKLTRELNVLTKVSGALREELEARNSSPA